MKENKRVKEIRKVRMVKTVIKEKKEERIAGMVILVTRGKASMKAKRDFYMKYTNNNNN